MPLQESDISWSVLRRIVHEWAGPAADLAEVKPLVGGSVNNTMSLSLNNGVMVVLKISPHRVNRELAREGQQLRLLRGLGLPVPEVFGQHTADLDNPHSYLLMEFLPGMDLGHARQQCSPGEWAHIQRDLAERVITLHSQTATHYGRESPDHGARFDSWPEFFRHVYDPIWHEVEKANILPVKARKQIARVHDRLDRLLVHGDRPRLVHWDIWSANVLAGADAAGRWRVTAMLDPNCKYAHAEAEIAYLELFHTVTPEFLKAYQHVFPLDAGYHQLRKPIYQLYPLINDVHLFGQAYVKPLLAMMGRIAALV
jgi:fructosamine-3-kinase